MASALRRIPDDPRMFAALEDAAGPHASEPLLRALFQARPAEYRPADRARYTALVLRLLGAADGPGVRFRGTKAFRGWARWYQGEYDGVLASVADPADPAGETALPVLRALVDTGVVRDEAVDVLRSLLSAGVAELADGLDALADLLRGRPLVLADIEWRLGTVLGPRYGQTPVPGPRLLPAARRLAGREHLVAHLPALRITETAGHVAGWPGEWREVLDDLRRSPHVEVQRQALDIDPDA